MSCNTVRFFVLPQVKKGTLHRVSIHSGQCIGFPLEKILTKNAAFSRVRTPSSYCNLLQLYSERILEGLPEIAAAKSVDTFLGRIEE